MKSLKILGSYSVVLLTVLSLISCSQKDESECDTIFDCPDGYYCSEDKQCVLMVGKSDNDQKSDDEQMIPDENDNTVLPDNEHPDNNQTVDNNVTPDENDEAVIPDEEEDDDFQHDEDFMDEDFIDEDLSDEVLTDSDEDVVDEDFADEDAVDDDAVEFKEEIIIGDGLKADNAGIPIGCNHVFKYLGSAALYDVSEIGQAGKILKVGWYDVEGSATVRPVKILMKETDDTTVPYTTWNTQVSGATLVFDQNITTVSGWNSFELTVPFDYSGTKNLLVFAQVNKGSYCTSNYYRYTEAAGKNRYWKEETAIGGKTPSTMGTSWRPNIKLNFEVKVEENDDDWMHDDDNVEIDDDGSSDEDSIIIYDDVIVGTGTSSQWTPLSCGLFKYTRSAGIYLGSEINVSSTITKISWYAEAANSSNRPVKIYLKETANTSHSVTTWVDMTSDATLLFDASVTISSGWNEFVLSAPFSFDKSKNLVVMVEMNMGVLSGGNSFIRYTTATSTHQTWNGDSFPSGSGNIDSSRPNIKLSF